MAGFFGFFDFTKEGPGVPKDLPKKRGIALFFDTIGRKFGKMISLNLIFLITSIPALAVYFIAAHSILTILIPVQMVGDEAITGLFALNSILSVILLVLLGSGPSSAGLTYIIRSYSTENHAWLISDFFEHFRKNFRQSMAVFGIDVIMLLVIITNLGFYTGEMGTELPTSLHTIMSTIVSIFVLFYLCMRMYLYPMMVTFDLNIKKLYKNTFLFVMMKLPQTIGMFLLTLLLCVGIIWLTISVNLIIGIILTLLILFSLVALMQMIYVYPAMMKVMVLEDTPEERNNKNDNIT